MTKMERIDFLIWECAIFIDPVDPVALNIPTYPVIVKEPMDFGTIRTKLSFNCYKNEKEFAHDMNLVFSNCVLFNGGESYHGKVAKQAQVEFAALF